MPLIALHTETEERINILHTTAKIIRATYHKDLLVCPYCKTAMIPVGGYSRCEHFRHKTLCTYHEVKPESIEHITAKTTLYKNLTKLHIGNPDVKIELECYFPECGENGRIADLAQIHLSTGHRMAFEIQLSPLSVQTLSERHRDYECQGIEDIWFFGSKIKSSSEIKDWADENLPNGFISLDISYAHTEGFDLFSQQE